MITIRCGYFASAIAVATSVSCGVRTPSSIEATAGREDAAFAVNIYEICKSSVTVQASQRRMDHAFKSGQICIDTDRRVIGIQPKLVRISSSGNESWQLYMRCEKPEPGTWKAILEKPSEIALVANGKVLADYRTTGEAWFPHCGIFTAVDLASATAICREVLSAWGQSSAACDKTCKKPEDFSEGTCVEPE